MIKAAGKGLFMRMTKPPAQCERCIIVFGRYPVPGRVKTRLIPAIGALGAAELQRRFTETCLRTALSAGQASVTFSYTGGSLLQIRRWLRGFDLEYAAQVPGDLGRRMSAAFEAAFSQGCRKVVLIGTDIPDMKTGHIDDAFKALEDHDLVLGPVADGGYWLVGVRKPVLVFQDIAWGTEQVLHQTLAAAGRQQISTALLTPVTDIDTPQDLKTWVSCPGHLRPYMSVIIPTFNEQVYISKAMASAMNLAAWRTAGIDVEVIVADGGSRDDTVRQAQKAGAKVIETTMGRAVQQNAGARLAAGDVLLFLHADTLLPEDYPLHVFETLMDPSVALGAFQFRTDDSSWGMRLIEKSVRLRSTLLKMPYGDQAFFMKKKTFERVGGFPNVPIAEDLFMARQLGRLGRIFLASKYVLTSARRWRGIGLWRATLINYMIAAGCLSGVNHEKLAPLYKLWTQSDEKEQMADSSRGQ
jgi:rSAM/selenodomain-associated transferase 2/rSAM/selenodomain-associated transferase 1